MKVDTISGTYSSSHPTNYHLRFTEKINLTSTTSLVFGAGDDYSTDTGETLTDIVDDINTKINTVGNKISAITGMTVLSNSSTSTALTPGMKGLVIKSSTVSYYRANGLVNIYGPALVLFLS